MTDRDLLDKLITARHKAGLSQSDMARIIGISPSAINQFENTKHRSPTLHSLNRYANAIGLKLTLTGADDE